MSEIYKCKCCTKECKSLHGLASHTKLMHNKTQEEIQEIYSEYYPKKEITMNMIQCKLCGSRFVPLGMPSHLKNKHNISVKEYYDRYLKKPGEGICKTCQEKPTSFCGIEDGYALYCSSKCAHNNLDVKLKTKATNMKKYGVECPLSQEDVHERAIKNAQTDEVKQKREQTNLKRYGSKSQLDRKEIREKGQTDEIKQKRLEATQKALKDKYGVTCGYQIPEIHEKALSKTHSIEAEQKRIETRNQHGNISDLEKLFMNLASNCGLKYIYQYYSEQYPYLCDFYLPEKTCYVEINGFWTHNTHWYTNSEEDLYTVQDWQEKDTKFYDNAIYTWTELDVKKRKIAKENNLNYVVLWTESDILAWFLLDCPIGNDWEYEYSWYYSRDLNPIFNLPKELKQSSINKIIKATQFNVFYKRELDYWDQNKHYDQNILNGQLKLYQNRRKYLNKSCSELSDLEIIRGLNISGQVRSYSMFDNSGMIEFIHKYNVDRIYDPCAGWGERLLTCTLQNIKYYGFDINKELENGYNKMISEYSISNQEISFNEQNNIHNYSTLFTCPPYWNTEIYCQDGVENLTYTEFLDWWKTIIKNSRCTIVAYQINQKYKEDMNQKIIELGYEFIEEIPLKQKSSHFTRRKNENLKKEYESIQVFKFNERRDASV